jgi:Predicted glycosyl hydrolase
MWRKDEFFGFGVQHTDANKRVFGNEIAPGRAAFFLNPQGLSEFIFSATAINKDANFMTVSEIKEFSALVSLSTTQTDTVNHIDIPIVQGMGFASAIYHGNLVPLLNSVIGVKSMTQEISGALKKRASIDTKVMKYRVTLLNNVEWLLYVTIPIEEDFTFKVTDSFNIEGSKAIEGLTMQVAFAPEANLDGYYDQAAGMYVTSAEVKGQTAGRNAEYMIAYVTEGVSSSGSPIVFAFPHQVDSLAAKTKALDTGIQMDSTTKGKMNGLLTNEIVMNEVLETDIGFMPWTSTQTLKLSYTKEQLQLLAKVANGELAVDIKNAVGTGSAYFSGKVLDKFAYILLVVSEILEDKVVAAATLEELKSAFQVWLDNKQNWPFIYDTRWGGVTSSSAQNGDTGADFGSSYYNDHHFHYGYFVHAAAIVGHIDKKLGGTWAEENKDWVNSLIRDVANPNSDDTHFPVSRAFDWFHGHSWAAGLFPSGDGKNEESSSEDYNFSYGMKLWGQVIGDQSMKSRGELMLAITSRAMNMYFYYRDDNTVMPQEYIKNKVSGIFFENKVDYSTFFGSAIDYPWYVHGIHMLPITPASSLVRIPEFVKQEWEQRVTSFIDRADGGWKGILKLNQALYDAASSYKFFSDPEFDMSYLDNGQSRTWSLAFSGGVI